MSKKQKWFTLYEESAAASNLSIAGGAVKLAALLLMIAAIPCTLALLLAAARLTMASGMSTALIFVMDELDDLVFSAFLLWGGAAACRYAASVLQEKARLRARSADPAAPPAAEELRPPVYKDNRPPYLQT